MVCFIAHMEIYIQFILHIYGDIYVKCVLAIVKGLWASFVMIEDHTSKQVLYIYLS